MKEAMASYKPGDKPPSMPAVVRNEEMSISIDQNHQNGKTALVGGAVMQENNVGASHKGEQESGDSSQAETAKPESNEENNLESEEEEDADSSEDDSEEEDGPLAEHAKMVSYMIASQASIAHELFDASQLEVYKSGMLKIEAAPNMQAKQAAMAAAKATWKPLLNQEQTSQMEMRMKEAMSSYASGSIVAPPPPVPRIANVDSPSPRKPKGKAD